MNLHWRSNSEIQTPLGRMRASDHLRLKLINANRVWERAIATEFASHRAVTNNKYICDVETMFADHFFPYF